MIVLDTNVLSELLRPTPHPAALDWYAEQPRPSLFTTSITRGEILYGIRLLPDGRRQRSFWTAALAIFNEDLANRLLDFDASAADAYAEIAADRRALGRPISQSDAMIAGITRSRGAALATRNVADFEHCGIEVINPWS